MKKSSCCGSRATTKKHSTACTLHGEKPQKITITRILTEYPDAQQPPQCLRCRITIPLQHLEAARRRMTPQGANVMFQYIEI